MTFGERLKNARKAMPLTQKQLAEIISAKHNSVSDWENNKNKPDPDTIEILCGVLKITPNYLLGITTNEEDEITPFERNMLKKYRNLDSHGTEMVDMVLDSEHKRVEKYGKVQEETATSYPIRIYSYLNHIACAGNGFYFDDIPTDTIEVHVMPDTPDADFVIGVNGDSMEPTYSDKENVFVKKTTELSIGDIGIFIVDNALYIKELGENGLLSHNSKYKTIVDNGDGNIRIIGKVTGKVVENRQKY